MPYLSLQGNIGLGKAIEYFTSHQYVVSLPLNDTQSYDLIVEKDNIVSRVQVKTTRHSETPNTYTVQLKSAGGTANRQVRPFDNTKSELLFVLTGNNKTYLIPTKDITAKNSINIGNKYTEYEVFSKTLEQYALELEE